MVSRWFVGLAALSLLHCTTDAEPSSANGNGEQSSAGKSQGQGSPSQDPGAGAPDRGDAPPSTPNPGGPSGARVSITQPTLANPLVAAVVGVAGATTLTLSSANALLFSGREIVLHQTKGDEAGQWEIVTVTAVEGSTATLSRPLTHTYRTNTTDRTTVYHTVESAQAIAVDSYPSLSIDTGGVLTATPWAPRTGIGGILAIRATEVTVSVAGGISMAGRGFVGGQANELSIPNVISGSPGESYDRLRLSRESCPWLPCPPEPDTYLGGGTGGAKTPSIAGTGGGGGGHGTFGAPGVTHPNVHATNGQGGWAYGEEAASSELFFGAGGGGGGFTTNPALGVGGAGGGLVIVIAPTVTLAAGAINVDGAAGVAHPSEGGGGGGAGGTVHFVTNTPIDQLRPGVTLRGGAGGGGVNAGGAGGDGRLVVLPPS